MPLPPTWAAVRGAGDFHGSPAERIVGDVDAVLAAQRLPAMVAYSVDAAGGGLFGVALTAFPSHGLTLPAGFGPPELSLGLSTHLPVVLLGDATVQQGLIKKTEQL